MLILSLSLFGICWFVTSAISTPNNLLTTIRGGRHETFASIVFQFTHPPHYSPPIISGNTLHFKLFQVTTALKHERRYRSFESFVRLNPVGEEVGVTVGIPKDMRKVSAFVMKDPDRLVVNLHQTDAAFESTPSPMTDTETGAKGRPPDVKKPAPIAIAPSVDRKGGRPDTKPLRLQTIRGGRHQGYASIVFQFSDPVRYSQPKIQDNEIALTLFDVTTPLKSYRAYKTFDSWVKVNPKGDQLDVRIGIPAHFKETSVFRMEAPHRLVVNLYFKTPVDTERKEPETSPPVSQDSRQMALIEASILGKQGQYDKSIQIYHHLLKRYPDDEEIWIPYIETLMDASEYEMAQSEIMRLLQKNPGNLRAQRLQARLYMELRQYAWTFPVFDQILNLNRADAGIWSDYAFASLDAKEWSSALNYFSRVLEMDPENQEALRNVHEILREHRPQLDAGYRLYSQKSDDAAIETVSGRYAQHLSDQTMAGIAYDWITIDRPGSGSVPPIDETINDALVRFRRRLTQNWEGRIGIGGYTGLGDGTTLLLGLDYSPRTNLTLHADFLGKRPWYDPVDAARFEGSYRQYVVSMDWNIDPTLALFLSAEHWDYYVEDDRDYGTKNTFTGILTKRLFERPSLALSYSYFFSDFDYEDETFTPIVMIPSESEHTLYGSFEHRLGKYVTFSVASGRQWDVVRSLSSWYVLPIFKFKLGKRIETSLSYEFNSESGTATGGETQTFRIWNRIIF